ncbi:MAG: outer membrane protein assembly factor BamB family protein [Planctomycetota bacterium]|jgi:outer membrane protein assembly factor BamB
MSRAGDAVIEVSAPLANLLARAEEGIARRDWKFAIDSLQRIIDDPIGSLVPVTPVGPIVSTVESTDSDVAPGFQLVDGDCGGVFESTRRQATQRIAALGPEGLRTYRLLYDGKAKRLFDRARATSNPADLRVIVNRYLLTRYGDDAADLLASWALDEGRSVEAVRVLENLRELIPDSDVPEHLIVSKLAAAYVQLGDLEKAGALITSYEESAPQWFKVERFEGLKVPESRAQRSTVQPSGFQHTPLSWPTLGGSSTRKGQMPAVSPELVDPLPWRFRLPGPAGKLWPRALPDSLKDPLVLPASYLVADAERLFVRTLHGCAALDAEDLSPIWIAPPVQRSKVPDSHVQPSIFEPPTFNLQPYEGNLGDRLFENHVAGSLAVAHGLVLTIEAERAGAMLEGVDDASVANPPGFSPRRAGDAGERPTVLVARDAATGQVRWQRGRTFDVADPLGSVDFRAAPLRIDDTLWVPYTWHADLSVAVLDAEDGSSIAEILLCSLNPAAGGSRADSLLELRNALTPAYTEGIVFVPSGHGVLFAVDAVERRLRWANRYRADSAAWRSSSSSGSNGWMSSPPVVSGRLVLLSPIDGDELLAFNVASGCMQWSTHVEGASYIIAADEERVWLGGKSVTCLSLADGGRLWTLLLTSVPSGRGVLAGDVIYLPTVEGLVFVDASTGDALRHEPLPPSAPPLGNLLCLRSSLFSVEPTGVRKYPDLSRLYPEMTARHERDPADVRAALQLGWMEVLRGEPGRALDLLDAIPPLEPERDDRQAISAAHLRVEALLASAAYPGAGPSEALELLDRARRAARTAPDRVRSGLALADQLESMGRRSETARTLLEMGWSSDADRIAPLSDDVEGNVRGGIARRLRQVEATLSSDELTEIRRSVDNEVARAVGQLALLSKQCTTYDRVTSTDTAPGAVAPCDPAGAREGAARLRGAADMSPGTRSGQYALIELAGYWFRRLRYERAEQLLTDVVRSDVDLQTTITALMHLAELYAEHTQSRSALLAACLDELDRRFTSAPVPDMYDESAWRSEAGVRPTAESAEGTDRDTQTPRQSVGDWVADVRERAAARGLAIGGSVPLASPTNGDAVAHELEVGESARAEVEDAPWRAHGSLSWVMAPRIGPFVLAGGEEWSLRVTIQRTRGELRRFFAPFTLPDELQRSLSLIDTSGPPRQARFPGGNPACLLDRVVYYAPLDVIYCQDASSGRLLWYTRLDLPDRIFEDVPTLRAPSTGTSHRAVADGQIAVFNGMKGLHAVGLVTGKRLWTRPYEFAGVSATSSRDATYARPLDTAMAAHDGFLAAAWEPGRLALMRMADGVSLWERDLHSERADHVWLTDTVVATADVWLQRVQLFDRTDGTLIKQLWFGQPDRESLLLVRHVLTEGIVCGPDCTARSDGVIAVDLATGEPAWRKRLDKPLVQLFRPREGYVGITLLGGDVRIVDVTTGDAVMETRVPGAHFVFDGVLSDSTLVVKYLGAQDTSAPSGLAAFDMETDNVLWQRDDLAAGMGSAPLSVVAGRLPVVLKAEFPSDGPKEGSGLVLLDLRTGREIGPTAQVPFTEAGARFNGDLSVVGGSVVAGTTHGIHGFPTEPVRDGAEDGQ